jgi:hypothetical protein
MTQLDVRKEKIAYLKIWLGIMVVTDISLIGWLLGNYNTANWVLVLGDMVTILIISVGIYSTHRRIAAEIERLEEL